MDLFNGEPLTVLQFIQLMLAPAVMISACGLLLLGMNNKYSIVVNRIRLLNDEKRKYSLKAGGNEFSTEDNLRLEIIIKQIDFLVYRVKLVRNAVLLYTSAVAFFVVTSLLLGTAYFLSTASINFLIISFFLFGMICVLVGVIFAGLETKKGFDIIAFEVKAHE